MQSEIFFEIQKQIGTLSSGKKGWSKQFNLVSWNGLGAKYDIRDWDPTGEKMGRGISLTLEELKSLKELLNSVDI
jgi:hypothetical protein